MNAPQLPSEAIFAQLIPELGAAIISLEEKKNINILTDSDISVETRSASFGSLDEAILLSKDVARMTLAKIHLFQRNYTDARLLLNEVTKSGFYQLEDNTNYTQVGHQETIFAITPPSGSRNARVASITLTDKIPVFTYTDVILSKAECELYAGTASDASNYIKQITDRKNISISTPDVSAALKETTRETLYECGDYFAFLKRNKLAITELELSDSNYLMLPIPQNELASSPNITQNPGY